MRICVFTRNYSPDFNDEIQAVLDVVAQTKGQAIFCGHLQTQISAAFALPADTKFLNEGDGGRSGRSGGKPGWRWHLA